MKDEDVRIPCELCNSLVKVSEFHLHISRVHGVTLEDGQAAYWLRGKPSPRTDSFDVPNNDGSGGGGGGGGSGGGNGASGGGGGASIASPNLERLSLELTAHANFEPPKAPGFGGLSRGATVIELAADAPALKGFAMLDDADRRKKSTVAPPPGVPEAAAVEARVEVAGHPGTGSLATPPFPVANNAFGSLGFAAAGAAGGGGGGFAQAISQSVAARKTETKSRGKGVLRAKRPGRR